MNTRFQALILVILILISVTLTKSGFFSGKSEVPAAEGDAQTYLKSGPESSNLSYQKATLLSGDLTVPKSPARNWNILDPKVRSEVILVDSLDEYFPFFHLNTYKTWPMASLTKLMTAVVVLENIGLNKKIAIDGKAIRTEGQAGNLRSGEVYTAGDLLKIMLLTSSNDAAAAFENYMGKEELVRMLNDKAKDLGMSQTNFLDASGLSDSNRSNATDLLLLVRYILKNEPDVLNWTRLQSVILQPINDVSNQTLYNIDPLVNRTDFLGGKTGTSPVARENLVAVFSLNEKRLALIILGSADRVREVESLLEWIKGAYTFN